MGVSGSYKVRVKMMGEKEKNNSFGDMVSTVIGVDIVTSCSIQMTSIGIPVSLRERLRNQKLIPRESWYSVVDRAVTELERKKKH